MKFAILNDTHCGARNSAKWMIDYQAQFYDQVFWPYMKREGIKHILHLGDYFDSRRTAATIEAVKSNRDHFITPMIENECEMVIIDGNHDIFFKNTSDVSSVREYLGGYDFVRVVSKPTILSDWDEDCPLALFPWITEENHIETQALAQKGKADYAFGHFEFAGFPFQKNGSKSTEDLMNLPASLFTKNFKMVYSGHYHTKSKKGKVMYLGSQMEFTWADYKDDKFFHVFDTETGKLTAVRNPLTIFEKHDYKDLTKLLQDADEAGADAGVEGKFLQIHMDYDDVDEATSGYIKMLEADNIDVKVIYRYPEEEVQNVDLNSIDDTSTFIGSVVDGMKTELDKDRLKGLLLDVYNEAQAL